MKIDIQSANFKRSAFTAALFFVLGIGIAIASFFIFDAKSLPASRVVNISADIFCMILAFVLYICCVLDTQWHGDNLNYFLLMIFTDFTAAITDEFAWLLDGIPKYSTWNMLINTLYYITTPFLAFLFWRYVCSYLNIERTKTRKWDILFFSGLCLAVVMRLTNMFFGFYFSIDDLGFYQRNSLYPISLIYAYVVMLLTLILVILARKRFQRHQVIALFAYALAPLFVGVLTIFTYGLSLSSPIIMMVFLLMYCVLNVVQGKEKVVAENELKMASAIQENMLPRIFPPYPEREEFDLYASMQAAKEVGGDFYDFFLVDDDHLALIIADVSGKGVPAALFMMVTKALIKNQTLADCHSSADICVKINEQLSQNNVLDMFVTAWVGVLTISTGELICSNAGHEYPVIKKAGGKFEIIKDKHAPPLGAMSGIKYKETTYTLSAGDVMYLYTDGVPEATNRENELFGAERMLEALNSASSDDPKTIDTHIKESIEQFVNGRSQFDDITMLCIKYNGKNGSKKQNGSEGETGTVATTKKEE